MKQKIAFLFLTRSGWNQPALWEQFFDRTNDTWRIFSHAKWPHHVTDSLLSSNHTDAHTATGWGDISLVHAQLHLLSSALQDNAISKFIFLSEACVPVKPYQDVYRFVTADDQAYIDHNTIRKPWITDSLRIAEKKTNSSYHPADTLEKHSQWLILNRQIAHAAVTAAPLLTYYVDRFTPLDEYFFYYAAQRAGLTDSVTKSAVTRVIWPDKPSSHPLSYLDISADFAAELRQSAYLFARKFEPNSNISRYADRLLGDVSDS